MALSKYLSPERTLLLRAASRQAALEELVGALCRDDPDLDCERALRAVAEREGSVSSRIAPEVALPHAVLPGFGKQAVAVGYSPSGVPWDSPSGQKVHLIVLSVSGESHASEHLRMLAEVARVIQAPSVLERLASAATSRDVYETLLRPLEEAPAPGAGRKLQACRALVRHAGALARDIGASALMMLADAELAAQILDGHPPHKPFILATGDTGASVSPAEEMGSVLAVPFHGLRRADRVKLAFLFALSHGLLDKGDKVVCVSGDPAAGTLHAAEVVDVASEFNVLLSLRSELAASDIGAHVLDRVLRIAAALAREGREGKPVGAIFVLGDYERVRKRCHQLVMNPFRGYQENERSVLDPNLEETIKEFSRIDGAFLIRGDGVIMSLGSFIQTEDISGPLEAGLGARHAAGMAITRNTRALSIVISESTQRISLFKRGRLVLALEQAAI